MYTIQQEIESTLFDSENIEEFVPQYDAEDYSMNTDGYTEDVGTWFNEYGDDYDA